MKLQKIFQKLKTKLKDKKFNKDISIVILSTDSYESVWYPFFTLLDKHWKNHPKTYLLTESKTCQFSDYTLNYSGDTSLGKWTSRIADGLSKVPTKYVIMMDGDYLLRSEVKVEVIQNCINYMKSDNKIVNFNFEFNGYPQFTYNDYKYPGFLRKMQNAPAMCSCQASMWNKQLLIHTLKIQERNPWEFESQSQYDDFTNFFKDDEYKFYIRDGQTGPFNYMNSGCIHGSKWYLIELVYLIENEKQIFDKLNLKGEDIAFEDIPFNIVLDYIEKYGQILKEKI